MTSCRAASSDISIRCRFLISSIISSIASFPPNCLLVTIPLNLQSFSHGGVDRALEAFWPAFDFLVAREVERISQGGIPVSAYAGRPRVLALLEEAAKRSSIPATADFEESIEAVRHLGIKRLAVAAKWSPELMGCIREYLNHAGITPVGLIGHEHSAQQVVGLRPKESVDVALELGREAFTKMPDADGLLLRGRLVARHAGRPYPGGRVRQAGRHQSGRNLLGSVAPGGAQAKCRLWPID